MNKWQEQWAERESAFIVYNVHMHIKYTIAHMHTHTQANVCVVLYLYLNSYLCTWKANEFISEWECEKIYIYSLWWGRDGEEQIIIIFYAYVWVWSRKNAVKMN